MQPNLQMVHTCGSVTIDSIHQNFKGSFAGVLASPATPYVEKDKWYHLVYTNDGINGKFYINGNLVESVKSTTQFAASTHDLYMEERTTHHTLTGLMAQLMK
jgi:hypothetical protein